MMIALLCGCQATKPVPNPTSANAGVGSGMPEASSSSDQQKQKKKKAASNEMASVTPHPRPEDGVKPGEETMPDIGAVGLEEGQLRTMLGEPTTESDDAPEKTLRYHAGKCRIDFVLYPDVEARVYRTFSVEVTNDDGTAKGRRICIADLRTRIQAQ